MSKGRIIVIDSGWASHKAVYAWSAQKKNIEEGKSKNDFLSDPCYLYFNILLSVLKRVVIKKYDKVIIAVDAKNSWRRSFYPKYKLNREELRKKNKFVDWNVHYQEIDHLNCQLHYSTDWHFIKISNFIDFKDVSKTEQGKRFGLNLRNDFCSDTLFGIEADDIQAVCSDYFSDQEVILVTGDSDLDQLTFRKNTKIFSTNLKYKNYKGCYKIIDKPLKILSDKIRKGDTSDNIIVDKKIDNEDEYNKRKFIIDLLNLPDFVSSPIKDILSEIKSKDTNYDNLPFPDSLGRYDNYNGIYMPDKMITWEESVRFHEKKLREKKEKSKKTYKKRKLEKLKEKESQFR